MTASGNPEERLPLAVINSRRCYTFRDHPQEDPFAIFGVADDQEQPGWGVVWFLATPEIAHARIAVLREAVFWLRSFESLYPLGLHNLVDSRNDLHLRWLTHLGFELGGTIDIRGVPFIHFHRSNIGV